MLEPASHPRKKRAAAASGTGSLPNATAAPAATEPVTNGNSTNTAEKTTQEPQQPKPPTAGELLSGVRALISGENPLAKRTEICGHVSQLLKTVMGPFPAAKKYNWLIIHDTVRMVRADTDRIYGAINKFKKKQEIALIITSGGGQIEPAYLISKLCRESTSGKFIAVVPRRAKSGATLICCGADEIHMGQMSELGPIDPQFDDLPALGLKNAVEHLAELASKYPDASEMLALYLNKSLPLVNLGYYERVAESAMQYAERLLQKRVVPLKGNPMNLARQLVYGYKDHGFVIDPAEATDIFGDSMVKIRTEEYALGNAVYEWLAAVERAFSNAKYKFYMYGSIESECGYFGSPEGY
jgi:Serine dehydrogenase proteinase